MGLLPFPIAILPVVGSPPPILETVWRKSQGRTANHVSSRGFAVACALVSHALASHLLSKVPASLETRWKLHNDLSR